jgi:ABC-type transport system involved in multi-copper enzyme maturation permease subunit
MDSIVKSYIVAKYSFGEIVKSKVLYNVILLGFGLVIISMVAAELTYGVPERVAIDLGLGTLSLSAVGIAMFMGVGLLSKEIESRTVYIMLSRPIGRVSFIVGKLLGMAAVLFINILILAVMTVGLYIFLGGELNSLIIMSILFSFLEALLVLFVVVLFSLITNNYLSVIFTIAVWIVGHALSDTLANVFSKGNPFTHKTVIVANMILPNFDKLNIKDYVIYKQSLPVSYLLGTTGYSLLYLTMLIFLMAVIFKRKSLD